MSEDVIVVESLTKHYGSLRAVDGISFQVKAGEIFGILGPNGAGKTTTVRMMTGVITPTSGSVTILGKDIREHALKIKEQISVLPETANVYVDLTGQQNMVLFGKLYGLKTDEITSRSMELLKEMDLYEHRHRRAKFYSKGMKQRLSLCVALIPDAKVLFLDEPNSGLDAESSKQIKNVISQLASEGRTILLTTHNMLDAQELCTKVAVVNQGRIAAIDSPINLRRTFQERQYVIVEFSESVAVEQIMTLPDVNEVRTLGTRLQCFTSQPGKVLMGLVEIAKEKDIQLVSANTESATLEDVFLRLVNSKHN
ncbi:MAG: ABC transporter ATP-binding protein [Candidatus Thorarchaeota archaeon]